MQRSLYFKELKRAHSPTRIVSSLDISNYRKSFNKSIPIHYELERKEAFIEKALNAEVLFYGDFHTRSSYQFGFKNLLTQIHQESPGRKIVAGLECFEPEHQNHIDDYLEGKITSSQLLLNTDYASRWGYFWPPYYEILEYAKKNNLYVCGINSKSTSLHERDLQITNNIINIIKKNSGSYFMCLIGEHHLADTHIPYLLNSIFKKTHNSI